MSKVLWVFIQSFKIRGKKKAKQTFCFVECVSEGGGGLFFLYWELKTVPWPSSLPIFSYGEGNGIDDVAFAMQHRGTKR